MAIDREMAEQALEQAKAIQSAFWAKIGELESMLGIEIDTTTDLSDVTVEGLLDEYGVDEEEHDQDVRIKQTGRG